MLRRILFYLFCAVVSVNAMADVYGSEPTVGVKGGYVSRNESASIGAFFQCNVAQNFRVSPELAFILRGQSYDGFSTDLNVHYLLTTDSERFNLYPLAGFNYTAWNYHPDKILNLDNKSTNRFGFNLGAGLDYKITPVIKLRIEGRGTITTSFSMFQADFGLGYIF